MKFIFTFSLLLFTHIVFAQNGTLSGIVSDVKGKPVELASVTLKNTKIGVSTKSDGSFTLSVPAGDYTVLVSSIGYEVYQQPVLVKDNETVTLSISLNEAAETLQQVEITGRKETTYKNDATFVATKSSTLIKDIPQSVSYVTKEILQDQGVFRVNEAVKNISGVSQFTFYNDLTIRGHRVSGNDNYGSLVNGMRSFASFWKQGLTPHLERIEVLKGPASALYGNTSPGGSINRVTKKPLAEKRQSLNFQMGSFDTFRATADFTGPMNEDKTLLYRLNLGYEDAQSFRDLQFDKNVIVAPSFTFLPTENTRVNFDLVYQQSKGRLDRGQAVLGDGDIYSSSISKSLSRVNDYLKESSYLVTVSLNHRFSKAVSFNMAYMKAGFEEDLLEHRSANTYGKDSAGVNIPNLVEMQVFIRNRKWHNDNLTSYFNIDFRTGPLEHKVVAGYDYAQEVLAAGGSQLVARGYRNASNTGAINSYDPKKKSNYLLDAKGNPVPNVAHMDLTADNPYYLADMSKYFYSRTDYAPTLYSSQGVYIQDQIRFRRFQLLLGLRQDYFTDILDYKLSSEKTIKQSALIPRVGLVYTVNDHINAYATYVEGYQPQLATTIATPNAGGPFDPLISNLKEAGLKTEWFGKRFLANLSVYRLEVNGALYNAGDTSNPDLLSQIGQEVSKGVEIDLLGQIAQNWSLSVSYAYNDATFTKSANPEEVGRQKPNAPKHQGNIWTKYVIANGPLAGLGVGFGANFVTERLGSIVAAGAEPFILPGYELINGALYYQVAKFRIQVNANNLANKTHWVGGYDRIRLFPGSPRSFLLGVGYTF
ncbi:TonB-dependent receptor [Cytophagaceae bacterium DM2B3-1]|uniref:TonB-dependent receptor n=1 Tax=Xanthocytophaga flava TaxID=3048013 RepID=A0ABT7CU94_9BACT|nr:TonB-dependent receptor [Xanthocytophaga flavus]MDJ1496520.1 TonB-dependent receptor [Xanthocytophaga flavus]